MSEKTPQKVLNLVARVPVLATDGKQQKIPKLEIYVESTKINESGKIESGKTSCLYYTIIWLFAQNEIMIIGNLSKSIIYHKTISLQEIRANPYLIKEIEENLKNTMVS